MTISGNSHQGEGCRAEGFPPAVLRPEHWTAQSLVPAQCVRVELVIHQLPDRSVSCWAYEVSNPHSKELLAKHVQPYVTGRTGRTLAEDVGEALTTATGWLLDPDPF